MPAPGSASDRFWRSAQSATRVPVQWARRRWWRGGGLSATEALVRVPLFADLAPEELAGLAATLRARGRPRRSHLLTGDPVRASASSRPDGFDSASRRLTAVSGAWRCWAGRLLRGASAAGRPTALGRRGGGRAERPAAVAPRQLPGVAAGSPESGDHAVGRAERAAPAGRATAAGRRLSGCAGASGRDAAAPGRGGRSARESGRPDPDPAERERAQPRWLGLPGRASVAGWGHSNGKD